MENSSAFAALAAMAENEARLPRASLSPDSAKRKAEEGQQPHLKAAKKTRAPPPLVTLKNSRLALRQKAVGWDRTMPVLKGRSPN